MRYKIDPDFNPYKGFATRSFLQDTLNKVVKDWHKRCIPFKHEHWIDHNEHLRVYYSAIQRRDLWKKEEHVKPEYITEKLLKSWDCCEIEGFEMQFGVDTGYHTKLPAKGVHIRTVVEWLRGEGNTEQVDWLRTKWLGINSSRCNGHILALCTSWLREIDELYPSGYKVQTFCKQCEEMVDTFNDDFICPSCVSLNEGLLKSYKDYVRRCDEKAGTASVRSCAVCMYQIKVTGRSSGVDGRCNGCPLDDSAKSGYMCAVEYNLDINSMCPTNTRDRLKRECEKRGLLENKLPENCHKCNRGYGFFGSSGEMLVAMGRDGWSYQKGEYTCPECDKAKPWDEMGWHAYRTKLGCWTCKSLSCNRATNWWPIERDYWEAGGHQVGEYGYCTRDKSRSGELTDGRCKHWECRYVEGGFWDRVGVSIDRGYVFFLDDDGDTLPTGKTPAELIELAKQFLPPENKDV